MMMMMMIDDDRDEVAYYSDYTNAVSRPTP